MQGAHRICHAGLEFIRDRVVLQQESHLAEAEKVLKDVLTRDACGIRAPSRAARSLVLCMGAGGLRRGAPGLRHLGSGGWADQQ